MNDRSFQGLNAAGVVTQVLGIIIIIVIITCIGIYGRPVMLCKDTERPPGLSIGFGKVPPQSTRDAAPFKGVSTSQDLYLIRPEERI